MTYVEAIKLNIRAGWYSKERGRDILQELSGVSNLTVIRLIP